MRLALALLLFGAAAPAGAQVDPEKRRLLQLGFNRPVDGRGPLAGYAYLYLNHPNPSKTRTLRLALAPVYMDSEVAWKDAFGKDTDVGLGAAGGGYADSYQEMRGGTFLRGESFTGDGFKFSGSAYHAFGKFGPAPLAGVLRGEVRHAEYRRDNRTEPAFELPPAQTDFSLRAGARYGGMEPLLMPDLAGELSLWYEGRVRARPGSYGFAGDRRVEPHSHLFWSRALMIYNIPKAEHRFNAQVVAGTSRRADRFSAYRLGGMLPQASEFPLSIPGYYFQEVSAQTFGLLGVTYYVPFGPKGSAGPWLLSGTAATAVVDWLDAVNESRKSHSGVGAGVSYAGRSWQALVEYGYGINAVRGHGNGAHTIGLRLQFDFLGAGSPLHLPRAVERGFDRMLDSLPRIKLPHR